MLIIFGKKITDTKKVRYALTEIFGIGYSISNRMCNNLNIPLSLKIADLTISNKESFDTFMRLASVSLGQLDSLDRNVLPIICPITVHIFIALIHDTN